jgi:hypothetical protein
MPPVDLIHLSADLGCERVGITMFTRLKWDPPFYPEFSVRDGVPRRNFVEEA